MFSSVFPKGASRVVLNKICRERVTSVLAFLDDPGSSVGQGRLQCVLAPLLPLSSTPGRAGAASERPAPSFASLPLPVVVVGLLSEMFSFAEKL